MDNKAKDTYTVDLAHIAKTLLKRAWIIILAAILAGSIGFLVSAYTITPTYSSSVMLYVNNGSFSFGGQNISISTSQISAAQSLVRTYTEILNNRTTLERIREQTGVEYSWQQLSKMIKASSSNGTEIMQVTVTTDNPETSALIANGVADILPERVAEIIKGASMEVVDSAVPVYRKVAPNITRYTATRMVWGAIIAVVLLVIIALLDDTIHDEEYILKNYNCPVLAKVPNLIYTPGKRHGYYYQSSSRSKK